MDVSANCRLDDLHDDIQAAMGWEGCHLWAFMARRLDRIVQWSPAELAGKFEPALRDVVAFLGAGRNSSTGMISEIAGHTGSGSGRSCRREMTEIPVSRCRDRALSTREIRRRVGPPGVPAGTPGSVVGIPGILSRILRGRCHPGPGRCRSRRQGSQLCVVQHMGGDWHHLCMMRIHGNGAVARPTKPEGMVGSSARTRPCGAPELQPPAMWRNADDEFGHQDR